jgi:Tfp pilus assembly protein PilO
MNKWSIETRSRVIVLALCTIGLLALIWLFLIGRLEIRLENRQEKTRLVQQQLKNTRELIRRAEKYDEVMARSSLLLSGYENQMARGDTYRWLLNWLGSFEVRHNITLSSPPPPQETELNVPPKVPYKAIAYTITGTARYHDFGAFLADFENSSPFIRLNSLALESTSSGVENPANSGRLAFRMEFVTLLKPASAPR